MVPMVNHGTAMADILIAVRQELANLADEKLRVSGQRYFKEPVKMYGIKTAAVMQLAKSHQKRIQSWDKALVFRLCGELWQSGLMEESFVACQLAYSRRREFVPEDLAVFEKWVTRYVNNWASCDTLCNHTIGSLLQMHPQCLAKLRPWTQKKNRWLQRAAAVSLIIPARQGQFLPEIFAIADLLLLSEDDLVQKGYGWMLKAASQAHPQEVFQYVLKHRTEMPRTALRYAIEKMPAAWKIKAMAKV